MNRVSVSDVTFLTLSLAAFSGASTYLIAHDYPVAGGLTVLGIIFVYIYHKFGTGPKEDQGGLQ